MMLADVLPLLQRVKKSGTGYSAGCPAHDDRHNSLSVSESPTGALLVHCHAGCSFENVLAALPQANGSTPQPSRRREVVATYPYRAADGSLLYEIQRYDDKSFAARRPLGHDAWAWGLGDVAPVLYHLAEIIAKPTKGVVAVEGEKDADRLADLGIIATTNPFGAGKWRAEYAEPLRGRRVVIIPDNDEPGRSHAADVARSLAGIASSVHLLELPDLPPKGDVSDWLGAGGTTDELLRLLYTAPEWTPTRGAGEHHIADYDEHPPADDWPALPDAAAYHGLAGDLVHAVQDATEADPVAILGTILAVFGALAGHWRTFYQGGGQAANLFVVLVGQTSAGRKGTSWGVVREMFLSALDGWDSILVPGLGSGEALISHLQRVKDSGEHRALVYESELGRLLSAMNRDNSTLSPMLRDAWDGSPLGRFLAREGALVTWHHVGMLAHVTPVELRAKLADVDAANGWGNRHLFLAVRRQRLMPFTASVKPLVASLVRPLHLALVESRAPAELTFAEDAKELWEDFYLSRAARPRYGLVGALTARGEAQTARLALAYALLDRSGVITAAHLQAAIAFWEYAERSARWAFGDSTGDPLADYIRRWLRASDDGSATRQEIRDETGVRDAMRLQRAIDLLAGYGIVRVAKGKAKPGGGPRPVVVVSLEHPRQLEQLAQLEHGARA